jgi:hypothetical protein
MGTELELDWRYEAAPCETCPNAAACRAGLACQQFTSFITWGGRRWRAEERKPTEQLYHRIFHEEAATHA